MANRGDLARATYRRADAPKLSGMGLVQIVDRYLEAKAHTHASGTRDSYGSSRKRVVQFVVAPLVEQTPQLCQRVYDLVRAEQSAHVADRLHKLARAAWTWAARRGEAPALNPWRAVETARHRARPLYFDRDWLPQALVLLRGAVDDGTIEPYKARFLALALGTGARPWKEVLGLRVDDFDFGARIIVIRKAKAGVARTVPMAVLGEIGLAVARQQIELVESGSLWPSPVRAGHRASRKPFALAWKRLRSVLEVAGMRVVDLDGQPLDLYAASRHASATYWGGQLGLPIAHIARILGHTTKVLEKHYMHLSIAHCEPTAREIGKAVDQAFAADPNPEQRYGVEPDRLREVRAEHKLTQAQLGALVGMSARTAHKWEAGTLAMGADKLHELAAKLGRDPSWFLYAAGSK